MGKEAGPSTEELEFIFSCFLRGLSEKEVLAEMEDQEFPLRNPRFIRERRRHFDAARKVLQIHLEKELDPIVVKRREAHFSELATLVAAYLGHDYDDLRGISRELSISTQQQPKYADLRSGQELEADGIRETLLANIAARRFDHAIDPLLIQCLELHLKAEFPDIARDGLGAVAEQNPLEVASRLNVLSLRKTFKGKCPVCQGW